RPPQQQRSVPQQPQAPQALPQQPVPQGELPPAGPGDGRTPLFDTLETNWFRGQQQNAQQQGSQQSGQQQPNGQAARPPVPPQPGHSQQSPAMPQTPPAPSAPPAAPAQANWRTSPNDELVRQAERVKQPSAGGVTTSGLPRRVPRANLVAGTAEQQQQQGGPQVSRAPDDVRGRLTNLRRGIQQGREAGTGQTGSFPSPSHQQER
ncbi:hypothetical protein P8605_14800, partial [Streptomyces sp. T-3]|nr:hypothetical protein [Streptomyces sp. T-3]